LRRLLAGRLTPLPTGEHLMLLVTLTLACLCPGPQGGQAADPQPKLTAAEHKSLHDKLAKLIIARTEYDMSADRAREKAQKAYAKAKEAFQKEWDSRVEKKGDLIASMADLQAIFANCFEYESRGALTIRKVDAKEGFPAYSLSVPKAYKPDTPTRTILLLPGMEERGWVEGVRYFKDTWEKAASANDTIFHLPAISREIELDPAPDYTQSDAEELEKRRNGELLNSFGETQRSYNVDRSRLFLDAGKGASGFALRAATHFPDRFAGLVLRHPVAVDEIRLGSITGLPVLLLSSAATPEAAKKLAERLNALEAGQCKVIETTDEYPFKAAAAEIEQWMAGIKRDVNRKKVVLEPNDDRFRKGFWVAIDTMDAIHTAPADKKPRVVAEADRATNRIKITAVGVESLVLQLNDALIDLDKEFTVVVNEKAVPERFTRDFNRMLDYVILRYDAEFLFPVQFRTRVPRDEAKPADAGGDK
jgi:hypothetical protein